LALDRCASELCEVRVQLREAFVIPFRCIDRSMAAGAWKPVVARFRDESIGQVVMIAAGFVGPGDNGRNGVSHRQNGARSVVCWRWARLGAEKFRGCHQFASCQRHAGEAQGCRYNVLVGRAAIAPHVRSRCAVGSIAGLGSLTKRIWYVFGQATNCALRGPLTDACFQRNFSPRMSSGSQTGDLRRIYEYGRTTKPLAL
jgi:hypothetical protein